MIRLFVSNILNFYRNIVIFETSTYMLSYPSNLVNHRMVSSKKTYEEYCPSSREEWRQWLEQYGATKKGVFLVYYKVSSGKKGITYDEAVEEALCFGWIDSVVKGIDDEKYKQFFSPRKPKSVWSKLNKTRITKLIELNLMRSEGLQKIEQAKKDGSWTTLDDVEELVVPQDLQQALEQDDDAKMNWEKFAPSTRKSMLFWVKSAKRAPTRQNRIDKIVKAAHENKKGFSFR